MINDGNILFGATIDCLGSAVKTMTGHQRPVAICDHFRYVGERFFWQVEKLMYE